MQRFDWLAGRRGRYGQEDAKATARPGSLDMETIRELHEHARAKRLREETREITREGIFTDIVAIDVPD